VHCPAFATSVIVQTTRLPAIAMTVPVIVAAVPEIVETFTEIR
jgi:hypothetical protein